MEPKNCACDPTRPGSCPSCRAEAIFAYWCESCRRSVAGKRCPYCGLKAKKKRQES